MNMDEVQPRRETVYEDFSLFPAEHQFPEEVWQTSPSTGLRFRIRRTVGLGRPAVLQISRTPNSNLLMQLGQTKVGGSVNTFEVVYPRSVDGLRINRVRFASMRKKPPSPGRLTVNFRGVLHGQDDQTWTELWTDEFTDVGKDKFVYAPFGMSFSSFTVEVPFVEGLDVPPLTIWGLEWVYDIWDSQVEDIK